VPAVVLLLIAPLIGEFLLGNVSLDSLQALTIYPVLALLYGSGAVLIREIARRRGRGYPTMFALALAYGILEEGIVTQSLFNTHFAGLDRQGYGEIPGTGITLPWVLYVLTIHSVWSIVVPIALTESLFWRRRLDRWVSRPAIVGLVVLYVIGFVALFAGTIYEEHFVAPPVELAAVLVVAAAVVVVTLRAGRRPDPAPHQPDRAGRRPWPPPVLTVLVLVLGSAIVLLFDLGATERLLSADVEAFATAVVLALGAVLVLSESGRPGWSGRHHHGVLAGAVLTYAWVGFRVQITQYGVHLPAVVAQVVLVLAALAALVLARRRIDAVEGAALTSGTTRSRR
jgi:hypothetical protein